MTMRVLIADDEPLALERLDRLFAEIGEIEVVARAGDGRQAAAAIAALRPELAFLDIRMPRRSGLDLAKALAADPARPTEVVFVTAYDQFAAEAFDLDAVDYLLKPVAADRLAAALARARRRRGAVGPRAGGEVNPAGDHANAVWVKRRDGMALIHLNTIEWIEAAGDYVLLHTAQRSHMLRSTMDAIQRQFDPRLMIRANRSALVKLAAVKGVLTQPRGGLALQVGDQTRLPVGHTYLRKVRQQLGLTDRPPPPS